MCQHGASISSRYLTACRHIPAKSAAFWPAFPRHYTGRIFFAKKTNNFCCVFAQKDSKKISMIKPTLILIDLVPNDENDENLIEINEQMIATERLLKQNCENSFRFFTLLNVKQKIQQELRNKTLFILVRNYSNFSETQMKKIANEIGTTEQVICFWSPNKIESDNNIEYLVDEKYEQTSQVIFKFFCREYSLKYPMKSIFKSNTIIYFVLSTILLAIILAKFAIPLYNYSEHSNCQRLVVETCLQSQLWNIMEHKFEIDPLNSCEKIIIQYMNQNKEKKIEFLELVRVFNLSKIAFVLGHRLGKEEALKLLLRNRKLLFYLGDDLKDDFDIVYTAFNNMSFISNHMFYAKNISLRQTHSYNNSTNSIFLHVLHEYPQALGFMPKRIRNDIEFVRIAAKFDSFVLDYSDSSIFNNLSLINEFCNIHFVSDEIRSNRKLVLDLLKCDPSGWRTVNALFPSWKADEQLMMDVVNINGYMLLHGTNQIRDNKKIVIEAVKNYGLALQFASKRLRNDRSVVTEAVKQNGFSIQFASSSLKKDFQLIKTALKAPLQEFYSKNGKLRNILSNMLITMSKYSLVVTDYTLSVYQDLQHVPKTRHCNELLQITKTKEFLRMKINSIHKMVQYLRSGRYKSFLRTIYHCIPKQSQIASIKSPIPLIGKQILRNKTLLISLCNDNQDSIRYLKETTEEDEIQILQCLKDKPSVILPDHLKQSKSFLLKALAVNQNTIDLIVKYNYTEDKLSSSSTVQIFFVTKYFDDKDYILKIMELYPKNIDFFSIREDLRSDFDIKMRQLAINPNVIPDFKWRELSTDFYYTALKALPFPLNINVLAKTVFKTELLWDREFWISIFTSHHKNLLQNATIVEDFFRYVISFSASNAKLFCRSYYYFTFHKLQVLHWFRCSSEVIVCVGYQAIEFQVTDAYPNRELVMLFVVIAALVMLCVFRCCPMVQDSRQPKCSKNFFCAIFKLIIIVDFLMLLLVGIIVLVISMSLKW